jgi:hypothetical protein
MSEETTDARQTGVGWRAVDAAEPVLPGPVVHWGNLGEGWEAAEEALALIQADLSRTVADAPALGFAWTVDQSGQRDVFVGKGPDWYFGANGGLHFGDGVAAAIVGIAEAVQDAIVDTLLGYYTYWPKCPEDGGQLHAEVVGGQARWLCDKNTRRDFGAVGDLRLHD